MCDGLFWICKRMEKTIVQWDGVDNLQVTITKANNNMIALWVKAKRMNLIAFLKVTRAYYWLLFIVPQLEYALVVAKAYASQMRMTSNAVDFAIGRLIYNAYVSAWFGNIALNLYFK